MSENNNDGICPNCGWAEGNQKDYSSRYLPTRTTLNGKYLIGKVLGYGGFGITYLAWDLNLNVKLAIKEYLPSDYAERKSDNTTVSVYTDSKKEQFKYGMESFLEEARTVAKFGDHPNIVSVKDYFYENNTAYFVMNYLEGITLKEHIMQEPRKMLDFQKAKNILCQVMDGLAILHDNSLLHRDISPDNIFVTRNGNVKILDFGAARYAIGEHDKTLSVILKRGFAPHEQYRSKGNQGAWTDIYALSATIYYSITGIVPPEALERKEEDTIVLPSKINNNVPEGFEKILMKGLAVSEKDRYQSIEELRKSMLENDKDPGKIEETICEYPKSEKTGILTQVLSNVDSQNGAANEKGATNENGTPKKSNIRKTMGVVIPLLVAAIICSFLIFGKTDVKAFMTFAANKITNKTQENKNSANSIVADTSKSSTNGSNNTVDVNSTTSGNSTTANTSNDNLSSTKKSGGDVSTTVKPPSNTTPAPPIVDTKYDGVKSYLNNGNYTTAVSEASKFIASGDSSNEIIELMSRASNNLYAQAQNLATNNKKDQAVKYYIQLATTAGVPANVASNAKSSISKEAAGLSKWYESTGNYYNAVFYSGWALWAGNTDSSIKTRMDTTSLKVDQLACTEYQNGNYQQAKSYYQLLINTPYVPANIVQDAKINLQQTNAKLGL